MFAVKYETIMEEVDNIIIHSLRQMGCDIDKDVRNLGNFNIDLILEATMRCLEVIQPDKEISKVLPTNMAARFRLGDSLAQSCLELGYRGDIGYQTFLYSSKSDLRRVLIFLIEKLPKENDKKIIESISKLDKLEKSVGTILSKQLKAPWLPHYCHKKTNGDNIYMLYKSIELSVPLLDIQKEFEECHTKYQIQTVDQSTSKYLLSAVISRNARLSHCKLTNILECLEWLNNPKTCSVSNRPVKFLKVSKLMSRFSLHERFQDISKFDESYSNCDVKQQKEQKTMILSLNIDSHHAMNKIQNLEIEQVKSNCKQLRISVNNQQKELKDLTIKFLQFTAHQKEEEKKLELMKDHRRIKARIYDLLLASEDNLNKLVTAVESDKNKLISLAFQWEQHRAPLIKEYRGGREKHSDKANTSQKKLDEFRQLKDKDRELSIECKMKDQQYTQLLLGIQKQPKDVNRSAYTQRILEIINNVKKQKDEIDKVLGDTREIQKEINILSGKLERSFTVVDELIYRDAKTSEASRRAHKLLATLHSDCSELVILVEETGTILREIRDLEEQIDSESTKDIEANLQRITADSEQMRRETASLMAQLASKGL